MVIRNRPFSKDVIYSMESWEIPLWEIPTFMVD